MSCRLRWFVRTVAIVLACSQAIAQQGTVFGSLSAHEVMGRVVAMNGLRAKALYGYSSLRSYHLECHGLVRKKADMIVRANYGWPNKKDFVIVSEAGSSTIRHRVFRRLLEAELESMEQVNQQHSAITPDNYRFRLLSYQKTSVDELYVLDAQPRSKNKFMFRGRIWIDAKDFVITRVEGEPVVNPSLWIRNSHFIRTYQKVGAYWLPESTKSVTKVRIFGTAVITITYRDYQIIPTPGIRLASAL